MKGDKASALGWHDKMKKGSCKGIILLYQLNIKLAASLGMRWSYHLCSPASPSDWDKESLFKRRFVEPILILVFIGVWPADSKSFQLHVLFSGLKHIGEQIWSRFFWTQQKMKELQDYDYLSIKAFAHNLDLNLIKLIRGIKEHGVYIGWKLWKFVVLIHSIMGKKAQAVEFLISQT